MPSPFAVLSDLLVQPPVTPVDDDFDVVELLSQSDRGRVMRGEIERQIMQHLPCAEYMFRTARHHPEFGKSCMLLTALFRVWAWNTSAYEYREALLDTDLRAMLPRLRRLIDVPETTRNMFPDNW